MGVWSVITGTAKVPKKCRKGLRDIIDLTFKYTDCSGICIVEMSETDDARYFKYTFRYEDEGGCAHKLAESFRGSLVEFGIHSSFTATIRYLT